MRFDRFTIRGQEAVQEAIGVAEKNQNQQVEPEHLLASMLEQKEGTLRPILGKIGANAQTILTDVQAAIARFPQVSGGQQYFSPRINTIFQEAQKEAEKMQDEYMSTEHLLLAVADEKAGDAGRILRSNGVTKEDAEKVISTVERVVSHARMRELVIDDFEEDISGRAPAFVFAAHTIRVVYHELLASRAHGVS